MLLVKDESQFIEVIELLIVNRQLLSALKYINNKIQTPEIKLRLQDKLKKIYLVQLEECLGKDPVSHLLLAQQKLASFLQLIKYPEKQKIANQLQNEIITDLRSQLDKAFLAFYRSKYGEPPLKNKHLNVFFPVIHDLKNKTVKERLNDYFIKLFQPHFAEYHIELFQYLEHIQPLSNPNYIWLKQLYKLANTEKHDHDLPLQPEITGIKIDMRKYLPRLIDGITELLLKLKYPRANLNYIQELQFNRFVPLVNLTEMIELKSFSIFHPVAYVQNIHDNQNSLKLGLSIPKLN